MRTSRITEHLNSLAQADLMLAVGSRPFRFGKMVDTERPFHFRYDRWGAHAGKKAVLRLLAKGNYIFCKHEIFSSYGSPPSAYEIRTAWLSLKTGNRYPIYRKVMDALIGSGLIYLCAAWPLSIRDSWPGEADRHEIWKLTESSIPTGAK